MARSANPLAWCTRKNVPTMGKCKSKQIVKHMSLKLSKQAMDSRVDKQAVIRTPNKYRPEHQTGNGFPRECHQDVGLRGQASVEFKGTKQALTFIVFCSFALIVRM